MMSAEPLREVVLANKKLQILSVTQLIDRDYNRREDYVLVGVLYKITHCRHDLKDKDSSGGGGGTYGGNAPMYDRNKRVRREYDRMFMFADVGGGTTLSATFCYIANTTEEGRNLLTYLQTESHIGIGRVFVVLNQTVVKRSRVKEQMVTIECNTPLIPLSTNFNQLLPIHKMKKPATHSCDNFFCYQNQKITIDRPEMITNYVNRRPSCGGCLCDRKSYYQANEACGCFSIGNSNIFPVVLEYSVYMDVLELTEMDYTIKKERSLRTTKLFVNGLANVGAVNFSTMTKETRKLKSSINNCVDYIIQHGGFTIMGTIALGRTRDPNNPGVLVDSDVPTYRVCYLFPTNQKIIDKQEYQCLMYKLKT
jgi:hypothetical protein